ncbi:MAG: GAF domain-containing sensor histidine kinase [Candidatus Dormibacteria bacterium]|jgi:signal transduction histidine kinase
MPPAARSSQLLDAVVAMGSDLSLPKVLRRIVQSAVDLVDARYGALGVLAAGRPAAEGVLAEFITVGIDGKTARAIGHAPRGCGFLGLLITDAEPLRMPDLTQHPRFTGFPPHHPEMHSFLGTPIRIHDQIYGNLYLTEKKGSTEFSKADSDLLVALASAAGVAIDNARLHERVEELAVLTERERIARDLHDTVIQRIFATGMGLQGLVGNIDSAPVRDRVQQAVDELDETIRAIRGTIFALEAEAADRGALRARVLALAGETEETLGFTPRVHLDGPLDSVVSGPAAEELLKTLREALSNVARHARASAVDIHVDCDVHTVTLRVSDNGVGLHGLPRQGHGIANMQARAEALGGRCILTGRPGGGLVVTWRVPAAS